MKLWDTLLIIGARDNLRPLLREIFKEDYNLLEAESTEQGMFLLEQNRDCIAAVLLETIPSPKDEDSFLVACVERGYTKDIPVLVIDEGGEMEGKEELAFSRGAADYIRQPFAPALITRRLGIIVDLYRSRRSLAAAVEKQADTIRNANEFMVDALAGLIEYRSAEAGGHTLRLRRYTEILLREVAHSCPEYGLNEESISMISSAASLHDMGKIAIPDSILNKPGQLTAEEQEIMKTHTTKGARMIASFVGTTNDTYLRYAYNICRSHHERWDGSGYPDGLAGDAIPICAQVVNLADAYDALTADRIYKSAISPSVAVNMLINDEQGRFSPKLIACFKTVIGDFAQLAAEYAGGRSPKDDSVELRLPPPEEDDGEVSSLRTTAMKYQTLLRYLGCAVVEIDLEQRAYHTVYNPFPDFMPLPKGFFEDRENTLDDFAQVHPDDRAASLEALHFLENEFVQRGLRRHSFVQRVMTGDGDYVSCRVTFIRTEVRGPRRHKALIIWSPVDREPVAIREDELPSELFDAVICRRGDERMSIISGAERLVDLTGYSAEDIKNVFGGSFIELVIPEDRDEYRASLESALRSGERIRIEYRIRCRDGSVIWVMERCCLRLDENGRELFYGGLYNNSGSHRDQSRLDEDLERHRLIIDQSDDIILDWDIEKDRLQISTNWKDIFGYEPTPESLQADKLTNSHIHPDDFENLMDLCRRLREGGKEQETELRIANSESRYIWFRARMSSVANAGQAPHRAVGTLSNIDSSKRNILALQEQAQRDSLTGLLNKAAAQNAIRQYLTAGSEVHCALLMIDLDAFKQINDRFGHLFGDAVLTRTSSTLSKLFRAGDIIGRVGGDEFMVLMKDTVDRGIVERRCSQLLDELGGEFSEGGQSYRISCSVGVALWPEHGRSFQELFRHADQALYHSKESGKHCFTVYRPELDLDVRQLSTPIESGDSGALTINDLVRVAFKQLANADDLDSAISRVMALVGQQTNVSRVYIFENNDENTHCSNTFEWCNKGISPEIHNLQNICYATDLPGWEDNYDENGILFCPDISTLGPSAREILDPQGIKSILHCAIRENGVFRGYIGLDECDSHRVWTQEQVDVLVFLGEVVVSFLLKKRAQDRAAAMNENFRSIMAARRSWLYVVDAETHKMLYVSEKAAELPFMRAGYICHEAIMNCEEVCEACPIKQATAESDGVSRIYSPQLGLWVKAEASRIKWDGRDAYLISCKRD